tara:strand:+ start:1425 stop:2036 length:612 start_codon:yes stop_codon:yes gene_type:complete
MVVGVSGVAGAGKDLFCDTLFNYLSCEMKASVMKLSIAFALKRDLQEWCMYQYGIDPLNCTREEKELIREFLVFHGTFKRRNTEGRFWIDSLNSAIKRHSKNYDFILISDVRYDDYPKDEVHWVKEELGGVLVHISQYHLENRLNYNNVKVFRKPANAEEARNEPKLKAAADYQISWEKYDDINKDKYTKEKVVQFVEQLKAQ